MNREELLHPGCVVGTEYKKLAALRAVILALEAALRCELALYRNMQYATGIERIEAALSALDGESGGHFPQEKT